MAHVPFSSSTDRTYGCGIMSMGYTETQLQSKFSMEHGVYADRKNMVQWLRSPAQQPQCLENNESIHGNPCGEYALQRLQRGAKPAEVVSELLREYLVQVSRERLEAYRLYREQAGEYWTVSRLGVLHWQPLYATVTEETMPPPERKDKLSKKYSQQCIAQRVCLSEATGIAEERIPLEQLWHFWRKHFEYARLLVEFPEATVYRERLPWSLVEAYRGTFDPGALPATAHACMQGTEYHRCRRAREVATAGMVAIPRACGDAGMIAAYVTLKCEALFPRGPECALCACVRTGCAVFVQNM